MGQCFKGYYILTLLVYTGFTRAGTHTLVLVLVLVFTTARAGYVAPIQGVSQQEVTRLVVRWQQGHQPYLHICMAPSVHWGTHLWACKTHEMREVEYSIRISFLNSWPQDSPPPRLVISRWLACEHNQCQTLVSALTPRRKITQVFTLPSGVWFTSMARLATKQKL